MTRPGVARFLFANLGEVRNLAMSPRAQAPTCLSRDVPDLDTVAASRTQYFDRNHCILLK